MRKIFTLSCALVLMLITGTTIQAQLNGNYTIGGVTPDYATFNDAVAALNTSGVSGAVVFNVRNGTYTEQVLIGTITGTSAANTITFKSQSGDSSLVTLDFAAGGLSNYTLLLTGASYVSFKKLTIARTGINTAAAVVQMDNGSNNCSFVNCVIKNDISLGSSNAQSLVYSPYLLTSIDNNNTFNNNRFVNGSYGIYWNGHQTAFESGNAITNNIFENQTNTGIYSSANTLMLIEGNKIYSNSLSFGAGISNYLSGGNNQIVRNQIDTIAQGVGIQSNTSTLTALNPDLIANNFVSIVGAAAGQANGILVAASSYINVYFNSVNIIAVVGTITNNNAFRISPTSANINVKNNIFHNKNGYVMNMSSGQAVSDYNDLYKGAINNFAYWNNASQANFAAWQTASAGDANSLNLDPLFVSKGDLHITNYLLNGGALAGLGVANDIDNELRDLINPDLGADEVLPPTFDIGIKSIFRPYDMACGETNAPVAVIVKNYAFDKQTGFDVNIDITGFVTSNQTATYTDTIGPGEVDTVYFANTINTVSGGVLNILATTLLGGDTQTQNDTLSLVATINPALAPPVPVVVAPVCIGDSTTVEVTPGQGGSILWYSDPNATNFVGIGNPLSVLATANTTLYAKEFTGGTTGCLRITKVELQDNPYDFIEVQNLSTANIDATGWVVAASNSYSDINLVNGTLWNLGNFNPGEIQFKTDNANTNYWGSNLLYSTGSKSWAAIIDNNGNVVDIIFWDYTDAEIQNFNTTINGFNVTASLSWFGDGVTSSNCTQHLQRTGNIDLNDDGDWVCAFDAAGTQSATLITPFSDCGLGCQSPVAAVLVAVYPAPIVNLGNDTTIASPNTVTLDAGTGVSYLWSTGATTQTIVVSTSGTYTVTVTDANGCEGSDVIVVNVLTALNEIVDGMIKNIYPQPATDVVNITFGNINMNGTLKFINSLGQVVVEKKVDATMSNRKSSIDVSQLPAGWYSISLTDNKQIFNYKILLQ